MKFNSVAAQLRRYRFICSLSLGVLLLKRTVEGISQCTKITERCYSSYAMGTQTKRLAAVVGDAGKENDVIFCGQFAPAQSNVIVFGGDVQDYIENMRSHRDNVRYEEWNLESTAQLLASRFPSSHIWVIKPSVMLLKTFNIYKNFLEWVEESKPIFRPGQNSWHHLSLLLKNAVQKMNAGNSSDDKHQAFCDELPMSIVGFSKGCVVLNQLVYDLGDSSSRDFISKVKVMYWLDGGHNGGSKVWITDETILKPLVDLGIEVESHVTPYQIKDDSRPWIGREHKQFVSKMAKLGAKLKNVVHFGDEERSIDLHFRVLTEF